MTKRKPKQEVARTDAFNDTSGSKLSRSRLKKPFLPINQSQGEYLSLIRENDITFGVGPAGTGKTYVAVAMGIVALMTGEVDKLIFTRPAVEAGEKLGFLPGDMKEKVDPYLRPIYDVLHGLLQPEEIERRLATGEIEIAPLAFMRGRTLANAYIVLDEAQNTTIEQMKMFLTRFGEGSKMVVCGDDKQCDLPMTRPGQLNGLQDALYRNADSERIGIHQFDVSHVVRHPVVATVTNNYEKDISGLIAAAQPARVALVAPNP